MSNSGKNTKFFPSKKDKGIVCRTCEEVFENFNSILNHHCLPYPCKLCHKKFEHGYQLNFHECNSNDLNTSNSFRCRFCNLKFVTPSLFKLHENSCSEEIKICDKCKTTVSSSPNKTCECKALKHKKRLNGTHLSCNGDAFFPVNSQTESSRDGSCNDSVDKYADINSERKLDNAIMDSTGTENSLDSLQKVNKYPSNLNNSTKQNASKLRNQKLRRTNGKLPSPVNKSSNNQESHDKSYEDETVKKRKRRTKKFSTVKRKGQITKVMEEVMSDVATESSNTTVFSDNAALNMPTSGKESGKEMISKRSRLKDATAVKVILSDVHTLTDAHMLNENIVEGCDPKKDKDKSLMKDLVEKVKYTLESNCNIAFNGIHSSHCPVKKTKSKKQASATSKSSKKRQTAIVMQNTTTDTQSSEKDESDLSSGRSSRASSPIKRKVRKSSSSSRENDSGLELCELSNASSMSTNSDTLKLKNPTKTKQTSPSDSEVGSLLQDSNSAQNKHRKDNNRRKSVDSNNVLTKAPQHVPLELEISESTLNDIPDDCDLQKVCHPRLKEFFLKGKKNMGRMVKTENNIELGDLLNTLPAGSGVLLKPLPGSFHNFRCPKCHKLFKHLKTGSKHLITCRAKFRKNLLITYNEIIYVCTACHYNTMKKFELTNHKLSCSPNSITDIILNYNCTSKQFICPKCSFSCLSRRMYEIHPCTKRLEYMKTCSVNIKKIDPYQFQLSDGTSISLEPINYETSDGVSLPQTAAMKAQVYTGMGNAFSQKGKRILVKNNADKCNTVDDIMKFVVNPVSQLNAALNAKGPCPDLDLDIAMPYESQELLAKAAEKYLSEINSNAEEEIFKIFTPLDDNDDSNDSNTDPHVQKVLTQLKTFKCKCKRPNFNADIENKPCIPCLNEFVKDHILADSKSNPPTQDIVPSTSAHVVPTYSNLPTQDSAPSTSAHVVPTDSNLPTQDSAPSTSAHVQTDSNLNLPTQDSEPSTSAHVPTDFNLNLPTQDSEPSTSAHVPTDSNLNLPTQDSVPSTSAHVSTDSNLNLPTQDSVPSTSAHVPTDSNLNLPTQDSVPSTSAHVSADSRVNLPTQLSEQDTSAAGTSQLNNYNLQQEITVHSSSNPSHSSCLANNPPEISINISVSKSNNVNSIPKEHTIPSISSAISSSSSLSNVTSDHETDTPTNTVKSSHNLRQSDVLENNSEASTSYRHELDTAVCDDDKCASPDSLPAEKSKTSDHISENISDNEISSGNEKLSLGVPSIKFDNNLHIQQPVCINPEAKNSVLKKYILPTSRIRCANSPFQKGEFTFTFAQTDCTVSSSGLKMNVTTMRDLKYDLAKNAFQDLLIELFTKLKLFISLSENDNSIFNQILLIICENQFSFVDIDNNCVHLYIHLFFEESRVYSAYVLKSSGRYICSACDKDFAPSELINHFIQDHQERNIYISILD